jgi:hypothetical protein
MVILLTSGSSFFLVNTLIVKIPFSYFAVILSKLISPKLILLEYLWHNLSFNKYLVFLSSLFLCSAEIVKTLLSNEALISSLLNPGISASTKYPFSFSIAIVIA